MCNDIVESVIVVKCIFNLFYNNVLDNLFNIWFR